MNDKPIAIVLTLVDPATMELHISGHVPNVDVALAMIDAAKRVFDNQWHQLAAIKMAEQMQNQAIAESLMTTSIKRPQ